MRTKISATIAMTVAALLTLALDAHATRIDGQQNTLYLAQLRPMNTKVTGLQTMGEAKFAITGGYPVDPYRCSKPAAQHNASATLPRLRG
jgi:hypothetical protein